MSGSSIPFSSGAVPRTFSSSRKLLSPVSLLAVAFLVARRSFLVPPLILASPFDFISFFRLPLTLRFCEILLLPFALAVHRASFSDALLSREKVSSTFSNRSTAPPLDSLPLTFLILPVEVYISDDFF